MIELEKITSLVEVVQLKLNRPVNSNAVRALLESMGLRDIDAKNDYGAEDLKDLAGNIYSRLVKLEFSTDDLTTELQETFQVSDYAFARFKILTKFYVIGLTHMLPVFIQIACVVLYGYALWVNIKFNTLQATAVVLGVIFGLTLTGGFVQIIGRVGAYYWYADQPLKAFIIMNKIFKNGMTFMLYFFLAFFVINFFIHLYPVVVFLIITIYSILIGILLLGIATMYPINNRWAITVSIVSGTIVSFALKYYTTLNTYFTHWIGILVGIIIIGLVYRVIYNKYKKSTDFYHNLIRHEVMVYNNHYYFVYGMMIYFHVFLDRLLAWSANRDIVPPYIIFYEQRYEIGMDLSIVIFFLMAGVLEYSISLFSMLISTMAKKLTFKDLETYKTKYKRMYFKNIIVLAITAIIAFIFIYLFVTSKWGYIKFFHEPLSGLSYKVFLIGTIGYFLLAWSMLNVLYMFRLNQSKYAVNSIMLGFVVNFVVGISCSRLISYEYSVVGFLSGTIVFFVATLYYNYILFKKIDYYVSI